MQAAQSAPAPDLSDFEARVLRFIQAGAKVSRSSPGGWVDLELINGNYCGVAPHVWARIEPHITRPLTGAPAAPPR